MKSLVEFITIDDPADPRLADYQNLRDVALRKSLEASEGLFIAEGAKVVSRALAAGYQPRSLLMAPRWVSGLAEQLADFAAPCFLVSEDIAEQVTGFHVHRGALASLHRTPLPALAEVLTNARRILVLEDLVDHTNVGAMFRNAAAFGFDAVVLSPRCADPLYRRSVKVAMGAVFSIPWTRFPHWATALAELTERGFTTVALTLAADAEPLEQTLTGLAQVALVLGAEGHGLSATWQQQADRRAVIEMSDQVDSLNVAAAAAVACYLTRQLQQAR